MTLIDFAFPKLRTLKACLYKCVKTPAPGDHRRTTWQTDPNTVEIYTTAPF